MRIGQAIGAAILLTLSSAGCQCTWLTDCYGDMVDEIEDVDHYADWAYHPELDFNRIGKPNWCRNPLNRALCHRCGHYPRHILLVPEGCPPPKPGSFQYVPEAQATEKPPADGPELVDPNPNAEQAPPPLELPAPMESPLPTPP